MVSSREVTIGQLLRRIWPGAYGRHSEPNVRRLSHQVPATVRIEEPSRQRMAVAAWGECGSSTTSRSR
ncbi:Uncharacterised protein [Mycobacteroides abscessus subsp. abscessus]|nr:Uncharacterised protein [Mycobacteroides abscessus subsp. abscessus]